MQIYSLDHEQQLGMSLSEAWDFFTDPHNLALITPAWLAFEVTNQPPQPIEAGAIICYRITPLGRLKVSWITEITHLEKRRLFVDEQRFGPYKFWHHHHHFASVTGGVRITDRVHYALYGGPLAAPMHSALIRPKLENIFAYRRKTLAERFPFPDPG